MSALRFKSKAEYGLLIWTPDAVLYFSPDGNPSSLGRAASPLEIDWNSVRKISGQSARLRPICLLLDSPYACFQAHVNVQESIVDWLAAMKALPTDGIEWTVQSVDHMKQRAVILTGLRTDLAASIQAAANAAGVMVNAIGSLRSVIAQEYLSSSLVQSSAARAYTLSGLPYSFNITLAPQGDIVCTENTARAGTTTNVTAVTNIGRAFTGRVLSNKIAALARWRASTRQSVPVAIALLACGVLFSLSSLLFSPPSDTSLVTQKQQHIDSLTELLAETSAQSHESALRRDELLASTLFAALCQERVTGLLLSQMSLTYDESGQPRFAIQGTSASVLAIDSFLARHNVFLPKGLNLTVTQVLPNGPAAKVNSYRFEASNGN